MDSCLTGDTVEIYVGPKAKRYTVYKNLLIRYEYFRRRILRSGEESVSRESITLTKEDPGVFELLICWLYRGRFEAASTANQIMSHEEATLFMTLYLKASSWEMQEMQNAVMDRLRAGRAGIYAMLTPTLMNKVYDSTGPQSPLRSYVVDSFIHTTIKWDEDWRESLIRARTEDGNQAFVLDCNKALFRLYAKSKIRDPDKKIGCFYHKHMEGEKCQS